MATSEMIKNKPA